MSTTNTEVHLVPIHNLVSLASLPQLNEEQRAALIALRMQAFGSAVRLRALRILMEENTAEENAVSVTRLAELLGVTSQGRISNHIKLLVMAGFLECVELRGRGIDVKRFYRVKRQAIKAALDELLSYTGITEAAVTS